MPVSYQEQHILEIVHTCIFSEVSYTVWHSNPLCWHSLQNCFSSKKTVLRFWGDGGVRGNAPKTSFFLCSTPPPVWCINFTCFSENQTKMITIYYGSGYLVSTFSLQISALKVMFFTLISMTYTESCFISFSVQIAGEADRSLPTVQVSFRQIHYYTL